MPFFDFFVLFVPFWMETSQIIKIANGFQPKKKVIFNDSNYNWNGAIFLQ